MSYFSPALSRVVESVSAVAVEIVAGIVVFAAFRLAQHDPSTSPLLLMLGLAAAYVSTVNIQSLIRIFTAKAVEPDRKVHG